MDNRIIALRGRGFIGKTTTIVELADELINSGWNRVWRTMHGNGIDIVDLYSNNEGILLGVASAGDNYNEVAPALQRLVTSGATVMICACRTKDMPNAKGEIRGTHTAMKEITQNITFVNKTIIEQKNDVLRQQTNTRDINSILNILNR
ncbi:MAG: hypothetical protein R2779_04340 [Crocinitomicaceae bacterium]